MSRPVWKGSVSFGLVNIPVELHGAVRDHRPRLRLLHSTDRSPVKYERLCEREGRPVAWADLVKGFEYEKGKYVVLTPDDFRAAALEKSKTIDITDFVNAEDVDGRYFETSYCLLPTAGGEKAYSLLARAIESSGKMGIGKIVFRDAQHLAALTSLEGALVLTLMRFGDEVAPLDRFKFPSGKDVNPKELKLAEELIDSLTGPWTPSKYEDEFQGNLLEIINAKVRGKKPSLHEQGQRRDAKVVDLTERLRESVEGRGSSKRRRRASKDEGKRPRKKTIPRHVA